MLRKPFLHITPEMQGILLMIVSMFCLSTINVIARATTPEMHTTQIVFLRNVLILVIAAPWIVALGKGTRKHHFHTTRINGHFWRACLGIVAMEIWFYILSVMPLSQATALSFTSPIFVTIFAALYLRERVGWRRWAAIAISFLGVVIIIRPDVHGFGSMAGLVLVYAALIGMVSILIKTLTNTEPPLVIVFYAALFMAPLSFPLALMHWQPVALITWVKLLGIALFSTFAHSTLAGAYKRADITVLTPFDFTRLLFTAVLAYVFFGEVMDIWTALGGAIIVISAVYITHREARQKKTAARFDAERISS